MFCDEIANVNGSEHIISKPYYIYIYVRECEFAKRFSFRAA